jgi:hypothetical protein
VEAAKGVDQRLLKQIFGVFGIPRQAPCQALEGAPVRSHQVVEKALARVRDSGLELLDHGPIIADGGLQV